MMRQSERRQLSRPGLIQQQRVHGRNAQQLRHFMRGYDLVKLRQACL